MPGTVGNTDNMTEEEQREAEIMQQAHFGFIQNLPAAAVVAPEGVYVDHVDMVRQRGARAASEDEGVAAAEEAGRKPQELPRGRVVTSVSPVVAASAEQPSAVNTKTNTKGSSE